MNISIPEHLKEGLQNYIKHGIEPGSFLQAVLKNDLIGAVAAADHVNKIRIPSIVEELWNSEEVPGNCWGSKEVYNKHVISFTEAGKTVEITDRVNRFIEKNIEELGVFNSEDLTIKFGTIVQGSLYTRPDLKGYHSALGRHPVELVDLIGIFIVHPTKTWEVT